MIGVPQWVSTVGHVVFSWWTPLAVLVVTAPFGALEVLRQPVRRAPWAGKPFWQLSVYVVLPLFWLGDALDGSSDRGFAERLTKGLVVLGLALHVVVQTLRWLAVGRPDEPLPVEDDDEDVDEDDDDDEDDARR
jgi:hypothetical protein